MKKSAAAIISSLLVLGCAYPVFAAPKNVYTDADSGFAVQTVNPLIEYASKYSYGFQENNSITDSYHSVAAIPGMVPENHRFQTISPKRQESFSQRNSLKKNWQRK